MRKHKPNHPVPLEDSSTLALTDDAAKLNLARHPRYLSIWQNNVIDIDVSHERAHEVKIRSFDLTSIHVARIEQPCLASNRSIPLNSLPDFQNSLKAGVSATLYARTGAVGDTVSGYINFCCRLFSWLINRGIYRLSQVTHRDMQELGELWPKHGWWGLLKYDTALHQIIDAAKSDNTVAIRLRGNGNVSNLTVDAFELSELLGLPIAANQIPLWFIDELAEILKYDGDGQKRTPRPWKATCQTYARLMVDVNRLSFLPEGFDAIAFLPYPNPNADAVARFPNCGGRTKNISISDAVKIFTEALRWIYDYKPIILEVANAARAAVEHISKAGATHEAYVRKVTVETFKSATARAGITLPINDFKHGDFKTLLNTLLTAAFCVIASNHGRRRNEVIGKDVPYGLYFGCLRYFGISETDSRIDVYIAKSVREYVTFWCNNLVRDAVHCLEELSQVFRPLHTPLKQYAINQADGRSDKLFCRRDLTLNGFAVPPVQFDFSRNSTWFFELAGVSSEYVNSRAHPFRRIYGLLNKYRYDRFKIEALSGQYMHTSFTMTEVYLTDAPGVEPENSVEHLYRPVLETEISKIKAMEDEIETEYMTDLIGRLFSGELLGGIFPKLVLALMKRLSADITFREQNNEEKARILQCRLGKRGYIVSEKEHGVCCCGQDSPTKGRSKCYANGEIHPENASPEKCTGCLHLLTTPGYRKHLAIESEELQKQQQDYSMPLAARLEARKNAELIGDYIKADEQVALETQVTLNKIIDRWEPIIFSKTEQNDGRF
jgi:hypothetical protein